MDANTIRAGLAWLTAVATALGSGSIAQAASSAPNTALADAVAHAPADTNTAPGLGRGMALRHPSHATGLRLFPASASPVGLFKVAFVEAHGEPSPAALPPRGDVLRLQTECIAVDARGICQQEDNDEARPQSGPAAQPFTRAAATNGAAWVALMTLWLRLPLR